MRISIPPWAWCELTTMRSSVSDSMCAGFIAGQLGFGTNASQVNLVPGRLWDFGDTWLGERKSARRKTAIYVARRLNQPETMAQVQEVLQARSGRPTGVILTTTQDFKFGAGVICQRLRGSAD